LPEHGEWFQVAPSCHDRGVKYLWLAVIVVCSIGLRGIPDATACAPAPPRGEEVKIAEEEAVIAWDPATRTEHFIRRASFHSTARAFGFLVPTPTVPTLGELPDTIYSSLSWEIQPEVRHASGGFDVSVGSLLLELLMLSASKSDEAMVTAPAIRVIQTARVAGFDATTVEADDPAALAGWLGQHGFATSDALTKWLERYVTDHWKLTAFVIATDETQGQRYDVATRAVHMTFHTDRPFYPYREPASPAAPSPPGADHRLLRVFFMANARYAATLAGQPWSARVLQATPIAHMPSELVPLAGEHPFTTVFVDDSSPRRGLDELYFAPSADTAEVRQPAIVIVEPHQIMVPLELIVIVGVVVIWFVRRRRRRR
jgi:Uncharacterized protein conserved in bacteria (DUF2330)